MDELPKQHHGLRPLAIADSAVPTSPPEPERSKCVHCKGPNAIVCNRCYGMVAYGVRNELNRALGGAAPTSTPLDARHEIALLLNRLVLAAIAKGSQGLTGVPREDWITDEDLEGYEAKILALAASPASALVAPRKEKETKDE